MKLINKLATATTIVALGIAVPAWAAEDTDNNNSSHDASISHKGTETSDMENQRNSDTDTTSTTSTRHHRRDRSLSSSRSGSDQNDRTAANRSNREDRSTAKADAKFSKASEIIGMKVRNAQNEDLGTIKDLVVDLHSGKASYAILSSGGVLGMGNRLVAVPSSEFAFNKQDNQLVLNVDKDRLANAPQFDDNAFTSSRDWDRGIQNYYSRKSTTSRNVSSTTSRNDRNLQPTGKENADRRSNMSSDSNDQKSDSSLKSDIKQNFNNDSTLSSSAKNVTVDVDNGVVTLRGNVPSERDRTELAARAQQCAGNHKVINELEVK